MDADAPSDEVTPPDAAGDKQPEREWWDDPGMPWRRKPTRTDLICMSWIGFLGVFSLAMLPLRAWLLGAPERLPWLVGLLGSRSGTTLLGSVIRVGTDLPFVWPILLVSFAVFIAGAFWPQLSVWATYGMWGLIVAILLEATYLWSRFRKVLDQRLPDAYRKGLMMYMISRTITPRRFRRPPTAIDRGAEY